MTVPFNQLLRRPVVTQKVLRLLFLCLLLAGAASGQINSPTFRYVAINFPGAAGTEARGINNFGEIVGFYVLGRSDCDFGFTGCTIHGFKLVNGHFTTINVTGSDHVKVLGVNDGGDIVGAYSTSDGHIHGFLLHHTGFFQKIDQPGSNFNSANGVNNSLTVAGNGVTGFTWKNGRFTTLDITNHLPKFKPQLSWKKFSAHETWRGTAPPVSQRFDYPSLLKKSSAQCSGPIAHQGQLHPSNPTIGSVKRIVSSVPIALQKSADDLNSLRGEGSNCRYQSGSARGRFGSLC